MSASRRAPGLVAFAALWGAVDVAYSIYLLASEPAGVLGAMVNWLPHARQAIVVSAILGIFIGGAFFVGAFMAHHGARRGLLVLFLGVALYIISGIAYSAWGLLAQGEVAADLYMANQRYGNEINNAIWSYFVGIGCTSLLVGGGFTFAIRRAWTRLSETSDQDAAESRPLPPATSPSASVSEEIERLNVLRERGLLTDDEYRQAKTKVLTAG